MTLIQMPAANLIGNGPTKAAAANHHQVTIFEITEQNLKSKYLLRMYKFPHDDVIHRIPTTQNRVHVAETNVQTARPTH